MGIGRERVEGEGGRLSGRGTCLLTDGAMNSCRLLGASLSSYNELNGAVTLELPTVSAISYELVLECRYFFRMVNHRLHLIGFLNHTNLKVATNI